MAEQGVSKKRVNEIFYTMEYGEMVYTNLQKEVKEWIRSNSPFAFSDSAEQSELTKIYNCCNHEEVLGEVFTQQDIKYVERHNYDLYKECALQISEWANAIEKNMDFICVLETLVRGILPKDTKKSLSVFIECLRYYASDSFDKTDEDHLLTSIEIADDCSLDLFGHIFAMLIGRRSVEILCETSPKFAVVLTYILKLAHSPILDGRIHINAISYKMNSYITWYYNCDYVGIGPNCKIPREKIHMLIFNDADMDSAIDCLIDAAWGHQGLVPWSVGTVLVQEDIFDEFTSKLKVRMNKVRVGHYSEQADVASPILMCNYRQHYEKCITEAERKGISVYHADKDTCGPMVTIGGTVSSCNVINKRQEFSLAVALLPFRSANEAVTIANNSRNKFAGCVWTENIGLANEISQKLKVGIVWINTHGLFKPEVAFTLDVIDKPITLGGEVKFPSWEKALSLFYICTPKQTILDPKFVNNWKNISVQERGMHLKNVAMEINNAKQELIKTMGTTKQEIKDLVRMLFKLSTAFTTQTRCIIWQGFEIKTYREPLGILLLVGEKKSHFLPKVINSLLHGNVILVSSKPDDTKMYQILAKYLPNKLVYGNFDHLSKIAYQIHHEENAITKSKVVWTNIGQSFS